MRMIAFTKRNIKEILRDPLSWVFMLGLPVVLFIVLEIMMKAIGGDISQTPQFEIKHMTVAMIIFAFSFLTIFSANNLSKDREEKFLLRLKASPMKSYDFILGYTLSVLPFALIQEIVVVITGICLGLSFSGPLFLLILVLFPVSLIFIGFGILFGSLLSSKAVGGVASIVPTATSLVGGMFFPLDTMTGGFKTFCYCFPFANSIKIGQFIIGEQVQNLGFSILICVAYVIIIYGLSIFIFNRKLHQDSI